MLDRRAATARGHVVAALNIGAPAAHVAAAERYLPLLEETQAALRSLVQ